MKNLDIRLEHGRNGFTVWINDRWIIDGSTFDENREFTVAHDRLSEGKRDSIEMMNVRYRFVGDNMDKRHWRMDSKKKKDG
jgi:hypothetical protein